MRLDLYLVENKFASSRTTAQRWIEEGKVLVNSQVITKPSFNINENAENQIEITMQDKYVCRGGYKLEKALNTFKISPKDAICLDIGASTGGFTDCLLQNSAKFVYAVDVGTNQLAEKLKNNEKVKSIEHCNARYLTKEMFASPIDFIVMDVSFISSTLIFPCFSNILSENGKCISLIKPQFEVGKQGLGKNGIVKDESFMKIAIEKVFSSIKENGFYVNGLTNSPILGGDGNREFLVCFSRENIEFDNKNIDRILSNKDL